MLLLTLLGVACCCGLPAYYGKPMRDQYPVHATLAAELPGGFTLREDSGSGRTSQQLKQDMQMAHKLAEETFAGVYRTPDKKQVTIFGATGFRFSPEQDVADEVDRLAEDYQLTNIQSMPTGRRGEYQRCATGVANDTDIVLCSWADHGSLGTALFTLLSVPDSAEQLTELRASILGP
jgi:hypothetical protein